MAKKEVIGHMTCPECGHPDAEIKLQKCGEKLYRYCPSCNVQTFARTTAQEKAMRAAITTPPVTVTEPAKPAPAVEPPAAPPEKKAAPTYRARMQKPAKTVEPAAPATPPEAKKRSGLDDALAFLTGGK